MKKTKIIFMGTPEFSVPILEGLVISGYHVVGVVTQPDKPVGRNRVLTLSPVKEKAIKLNIPVFTPAKITNEFKDILELEPDLIITAAYGQFIPDEVLNYPKSGAINIHGSLLPKYRGGAPIHEAIKNGECETGITIMYMAKKMDSGDILFQRKIPILEEDNVGTMFHKLSILGKELLLETIDKIIDRNVVPKKQDPDLVTYAYNIKRTDEKLSFHKGARDVYNHVRAYYPWPTTYTTIDGIKIKILKCKVSDHNVDESPGTICDIKKDSFGIVCKDKTVIDVFEVQMQGKKQMKVRDFLNGAGKNLVREGIRVT